MAKYTASYDFPQGPDCIYGILSDVERMRDFMPLCKRSQVLSRQTTSDAEVVEANFLLRYRRIEFEYEFDLVLTLRPGERRIDFELADTTFASGSARCTVTGAGRTGSRLLIEVDCKIRNVLVRILFGRLLLLKGMQRIVDGVRQRAEASCGR